MTNPLSRTQTTWRVTVPEHQIDRYEIPAATHYVVTEDRDIALEHATLRSHVRAEVPPWKPYFRQTLVLCQAERVE